MSIGAELAAARQQAGMSIAEVSQQTRIRPSIIQAIESDDFSGCGADFYARGHIRAIAHATGMDAEPLVQEYDARLGTSPPGAAKPAASPVSTVRWGAPPAGTAAGPPGPPGPDQPGQRRKRNVSIALLILLVTALGLVIYHYHDATLPRPAAAAAASHNHATRHHAGHKHSTASAAHHGTRRMVISVAVVNEPCWVELTTRGGGTIFENVIPPGTSRSWRVRRDVTLRLGNPGAVTLKVDGKRRAGLGSAPVVLRLRPGH
jgi:transcriptional regulator with XRE-family HTH domain